MYSTVFVPPFARLYLIGLFMESYSIVVSVPYESFLYNGEPNILSLYSDVTSPSFWPSTFSTSSTLLITFFVLSAVFSYDEVVVIYSSFSSRTPSLFESLVHCFAAITFPSSSYSYFNCDWITESLVVLSYATAFLSSVSSVETT